MSREPIWLLKSVVLALHDEQIAEHGGLEGLRDDGLLDSALARPRHAFAYGDPSLFEMAAALAVGICKNHLFLDGNKRTSLVATELLLELNGFDLAASDAEIVSVWRSLAASSVTEAELAEWLERHCTLAW
jgi:death on curing protein